jgi:hypothetical protein
MVFRDLVSLIDEQSLPQSLIERQDYRRLSDLSGI